MDKMINFEPVPSKNVNINDSFWSRYIELVREAVIPYQWEALNDRVPDAEPSFAIRNFRIAAGEEEGEFGGLVFQDSDLAKWLEAVGHSLKSKPDAELEKWVDSVIELIEKAQLEDGYINTYYILKEPDKRWTNLWECHELYCAGHMMEAAVAYYEATGKRKLLDAMCRFADHIDARFGPEEGKLKGYPGHQEIELALVKLYRTTGNDKYLKLAKFFIDERGKEPNYFVAEWEKRGRTSHWTQGRVSRPNTEYNQAHLPVREQTKAVGHAVRAVYMYAGMADIARETGDTELMDACRRLWNNITAKQMYITGGIGSTNHGEAFTFDYDLPNDTVYSETCASIGLIFFAHRMLQLEAKSDYADVMERALYNTVISGMSQDGKHFFYVNPLDVWPEASEKNPSRRHVRPVRQKWFGCACCPPNVARLLSSLGQYVYTSNESAAYVHLYIGGEAEIGIGGDKIKIAQETNYPWDGNVKLKISKSISREFSLGLRIPKWCKNAVIRVNGEIVDMEGAMKDGYAVISRIWHEGDCVELDLDMPVEIIQSNPKVRANAGKVAVQRGPLVYCLEEVDNGPNLAAIALSDKPDFTAVYTRDFFNGAVMVKGKAFRTSEEEWGNELYRSFERREVEQEIIAVPYYLWGNRKPGEMLVWLRMR